MTTPERYERECLQQLFASTDDDTPEDDDDTINDARNDADENPRWESI